MKTPRFTSRYFLPMLTTILFLQASITFQSCKKTVEPSVSEEEETKRKPQNPPPPPAFYFTNCNNPTYSASFTVGVAASIPIVKNYVNSPGGSYDAFTSATVNGITISAPAGTFNIGSGSVTFTATGTPINTGSFTVWIGAGSIQQCMMFFIVLNAPASGPTVDPGPAEGSTGVVNFIYKGQSVSYTT
ncbi:MAG TPA: hypothetical protein VF144_02945, partial [Chitinophagaceae bacterium]